MRVYLAGAINGKSDAECRDWREEAKRLLVGHECVDPMRRDYRGVEAANVVAIVDGDTRDIRSCDAVLVNASAPSWGTAMEVAIAARELFKRVVAFTDNPRPSPWLLAHAVVRSSLADAVAEILR